MTPTTPKQAANTSVALYARVSTEDQAERQTIKGQIDFLRKYCDLHQIAIAGEYVDDGISGAVALDKRPEGRRLLDAAHAGQIGAVLVYRLDRLGRSLSSLLSAHEELDGAGVAIRSATEPFDTSSPIGRFLFQLLGSMAELERESIKERMTMGRDRVARGGAYTGGVMPLGYDVDAEGLFVTSARMIPELNMTEADLVRDLFTRVAGGSSLIAEAQRLNALGVAPVNRYGRSKPKRKRTEGADASAEPKRKPALAWTPGRLWYVLHNPMYAGLGALNSRHGAIVRPAPALIDTATWEAAQVALKRNQIMSTRNAKHVYLLRGLITCENCGLGYHGTTAKTGSGKLWRHYRCNGKVGSIRPDPATRCTGRAVGADWLEASIWEQCRAFIYNPGEALADAQRELRDRLEKVAGLDDERRRLVMEVAAKDTERERVLTMYRRGTVTIDEAERDLETIARETATLRELLESLRAQEALAAAHETHLTDAMTYLALLRDRLEDIEVTNDLAAKQDVMGLLISRVRVRSVGRNVPPEVRVRFTFASPAERVVGVVSDTAARASSPATRS
jgi:site-specific DNA recombinase